MSTFVTIFIGTTGALLAWLLGAPVPFLTGSASLITLCALFFRLDCQISVPIRNISFVIIGISTMEGINSSVLNNILNWPISLVGMTLSIITLVIIGKNIFHNYFQMGRNEAILACIPGHLSFVLSLSELNSSSTAVISVIQSIRVLTLTLAIPLTLSFFVNFEVHPNIPDKNILSLSNLLILITFSVSSGFVLYKYKIPVAFLIGGMISSSIGHGFGLTPGKVPDYLTFFAFIILGSLIGSRFTGVNFKVFKSCVIRGSLFTAISLIIATLAAFIISNLTEFEIIDLFIAFAPGGLETMMVMGQFVGADPTFIAFHHLARLFLLFFILSTVIKKVN